MITRIRLTDFPVAPTDTIVTEVDVRATRLLAVSVKNLDEGVQTVTLWLMRRANPLDDFAPSQQHEEFIDIPPGETRQVDIDVGTNHDLEVHAIASGLGCNINLTIKPGEPYP